MNETDTLQAYFDQYAESTQLQWQIEDAANNAPWTAEWIYIFILAVALYLFAAALIHNVKQRKKRDDNATNTIPE